jgi:hypothetical protein
MWLIIGLVWGLLILLIIKFFMGLRPFWGRCSAAGQCQEYLCSHYQVHNIYEDCDRHSACKVGNKVYLRRCG